MSAQTLSDLLREPGHVAQRCLEGRALRELTLVSLLAIAAGGALFGATIGGFRGGLQVLYSALKVPSAFLLTLAVCAPAYYALANVLGRPWPLRTVAALAMSSIARASLVLIAAVPMLWFLIDVRAGYHTTAVWASVAFAAAGCGALGVIYRALGAAPRRLVGLMLMVALFGLVGGQTAWSLRPYLGRPSQDDVPFLRAPDGMFTEHLWTSGRSSMGIYDSPRDWLEEPSR